MNLVFSKIIVSSMNVSMSSVVDMGSVQSYCCKVERWESFCMEVFYYGNFRGLC